MRTTSKNLQGNKMTNKIKYIQLDTHSFLELCNENQSLKHEILLLEAHIRKLQESAATMRITNRSLKSQVNSLKGINECKFDKHLENDITSFYSVVNQNHQLKKDIADLKRENMELKEKLSESKDE